MPDIDSLLNRWQLAGVLDDETVRRIRAWEAGQKSGTGLRWEGVVALLLGAILLACGVVLFVSAHWDELGPGARYSLVMAMVAVFHVGGAWARPRYRALSTALHAAGTAVTGVAIVLVSQIFSIQEHWPAAVMLWAIAALAGWALLGDQAQQILTLLLLPAWIFCELAYYAEGHIGQEVYLGRFLFVWAVLYLTFFLASKRKALQGILFAAGVVASTLGMVQMVLDPWSSWNHQTFLSFGTRFWGWAAIAALPLVIAAFKGHKGLIPVAAAIALSIALPWCYRTHRYDNGGGYVRAEPNILAHTLVAAFAAFLIWWGVRQASRALVNFGIFGFAITVAWFYFSDIFDKVGRSLGLIGLGILFLAGGWALEKTRRRLITGIRAQGADPQEAP